MSKCYLSLEVVSFILQRMIPTLTFDWLVVVNL